MTPVSALLPGELHRLLGLDSPYRGRQIFRWIHRLGILDFQAMTDLPEPLRASLAASAAACTLIEQERVRDLDGSQKWSFRGRDGAILETVMLQDRRERGTACLSVQAGCGMGCRFCKTGTLGLSRDLHDHEIVEQVLLLRACGRRVDNIVFMGMGEPLANLDAVFKSVEVLGRREGMGLSARRITVSTCGLTDGILRLAHEGPPLRLALSLISADPALRRELMPVEKLHPLAKVKEALLEYQRARGKRITLEVVLLEGINDRPEDLNKLLEFIPPLRVLVNLIPWNRVAGLPFREPSGKRVRWFRERLEAAGVRVSARFSRGRAVAGACGQLGARPSGPPAP